MVILVGSQSSIMSWARSIMFDDLQQRLSSAFRRFRVSGILTEARG
jgi:hypothetical protein